MDDSFQLEHRVASGEIEELEYARDLQVIDHEHATWPQKRVEVEVFQIRKWVGMRPVEQHRVEFPLEEGVASWPPDGEVPPAAS